MRRWWMPPASVATLVSTDQATGAQKLELYLGPRPWWPVILAELLLLNGMAYLVVGRRRM